MKNIEKKEVSFRELVNKKIKNFNWNDNIKVQKILYFLYGVYYKDTGEEIINNPIFYSFKYGPFEENYSKKKDIILHIQNDKIDNVIDYIKRLNDMDTIDLIELSHETAPWITAGSGKELWKRMDNEEIREYFKKQ